MRKKPTIKQSDRELLERLNEHPELKQRFEAILALAAQRETVLQGMFLLLVYSAGLAIPFLLTSLGLTSFLKFYGGFRKHLHAVEVASGVLLIALGTLMAFNKLTIISGYFSFLNRFSL